MERESDGKHDGKPQFGKAWLVGQLQAAGSGSLKSPISGHLVPTQVIALSRRAQPHPS